MKKLFSSTLLLSMLLCITTLVACSSSDDSSGQTVYRNVSVTVAGNEYSGIRLYTDFGVILIPTNINQLPLLKDVNRASISFSLLNEILTLSDLEEGNAYDVLLEAASCYEIPSFTQCIDVTSSEYLENGNDTIATKNKMVTQLDVNTNLFYVKNGYLNTVATFQYADQPVCFSLYYKGVEEVNAAERELTLNLYYNNNTNNPVGSVTSPLSFRLSSEIYAKFKDGGVADYENIDVYLKASTVSGGNTKLHYEMKLTDLLLP